MANYLIKIEPAGEVAHQEVGLQTMINVSDLEAAKGEADTFAERHRKWSAKASVKLLNETGLLATRVGRGTWAKAR